MLDTGTAFREPGALSMSAVTIQTWAVETTTPNWGRVKSVMISRSSVSRTFSVDRRHTVMQRFYAESFRVVTRVTAAWKECRQGFAPLDELNPIQQHCASASLPFYAGEVDLAMDRYFGGDSTLLINVGFSLYTTRLQMLEFNITRGTTLTNPLATMFPESAG